MQIFNYMKISMQIFNFCFLNILYLNIFKNIIVENFQKKNSDLALKE